MVLRFLDSFVLARRCGHVLGSRAAGLPALHICVSWPPEYPALRMQSGLGNASMFLIVLAWSENAVFEIYIRLHCTFVYFTQIYDI